MSNHEYEEIPSVKLSLEDLYIDDTISDQKKYLDNRSDRSDTDEMPEMPKRIYFMLEDFTKKGGDTGCQYQGACSCHIYH